MTHAGQFQHALVEADGLSDNDGDVVYPIPDDNIDFSSACAAQARALVRTCPAPHFRETPQTEAIDSLARPA